MRRQPWKTAALAVLTIAALNPPAGRAEEKPRDRLRQRMEERNTPTAVTAVSPGAQTLPPGDHEYTLEHGGMARRYRVHVPKGVEAGRPLPLVFAFHGGGGDARLMSDDERYGLISKSEQAGFVVLFPNGYSRFPRGRLATWNAGECCGEARDRGVDDVGFVRTILADVRSRIPVDPARIYATGMSNGGMFSHRLACEMADVFAAVAPVAGTDNTRQCAPARPISVLHIHARDDDHVLFDGGAGANAFPDQSKVTVFTSVPETMARWTARDGCKGPPTRSLSRPGAWCDTWGQCSSGVAVELCLTETGGHSWPGATSVRRGKEPASQALSADDVIWEFFKAHPK